LTADAPAHYPVKEIILSNNDTAVGAAGESAGNDYEVLESRPEPSSKSQARQADPTPQLPLGHAPARSTRPNAVPHSNNVPSSMRVAVGSLNDDVACNFVASVAHAAYFIRLCTDAYTHFGKGNTRQAIESGGSAIKLLTALLQSDESITAGDAQQLETNIHSLATDVLGRFGQSDVDEQAPKGDHRPLETGETTDAQTEDLRTHGDSPLQRHLMKLAPPACELGLALVAKNPKLALDAAVQTASVLGDMLTDKELHDQVGAIATSVLMFLSNSLPFIEPYIRPQLG
jgi:hypothetical protein